MTLVAPAPSELAILIDPYSVSPKSAVINSLVERGLLDRRLSNVWRTTAGEKAMENGLKKQSAAVQQSELPLPPCVHA